MGTPRAARGAADDGPSTRGMYAAGKETRRTILEVASRLFREHGLAGTSKSDIAQGSGVFPSQLGYYFGTKEALFVEAACRDLLHLATRVEHAGARARTPTTYMRAMVRTALDSPALLFFAEAVLIVRNHPELAPRVTDAIERLHREGERAVGENLAKRGWRMRASGAPEARGFWAAALGLALEQSAFGPAFRPATAEATVQLVLDIYEPEPPRGREGRS
ncbi:MAG: TetR/AcrR family transcriptional regulator C-terminal domain-containing protein [Solirubrobacteraceae bacterium]